MLRASSRTRPSQASGFTLIEIMVVVVILGLLAALIAPNVIGRIDDARATKAKQDIRAIESSLQLFRLDNFRYPSTEEGLRSLSERPNDPNVKWPEGGYLDRVPVDPWNREYIYLQPGTRGAFDIYTLGRDGQEGGEGPDADIGNWDLDG